MRNLYILICECQCIYNLQYRNKKTIFIVFFKINVTALKRAV